MTSTKVILLGILIMLLGLAVNSAAVYFVTFRAGVDATGSLFYIAAALFVVGLIVGVIGSFRK